jgi:hypothetical protein
MHALLQISAINGVTCGIYMGGRSSKVAPDRLGQREKTYRLTNRSHDSNNLHKTTQLDDTR